MFFDGHAGSGNDVTYRIRPPQGPATKPTQDSANGVNWDFEQRAAYWFGMILCDTQSSPEYQHEQCKPDSDGNIFDTPNAAIPVHGKGAGQRVHGDAVLPPGWVPQFTGFDCPGLKWCVSMTIDSLNIDQNTRGKNNERAWELVGRSPSTGPT